MAGLCAFTATLAAHRVALPAWAAASAVCTLDLRPVPEGAQAELSLRPSDAAAVLGQGRYRPGRDAGRLRAALQAGLKLDGQSPALMQPEPDPGPDILFRARWSRPLSGRWTLTVGFFDDPAPAWCRVFVFQDDASFSGPHFFSSDQPFEWPRPVAARAWLGRFFVLGFHHILPEGLDHILFVLGLCLAAASLRSLLGQVTAFTVAHTLTLGLAASGRLGLHSSVVEPLIAASIALVAIENLARRDPPRWRWMLVFGFGLIHGLGFAGALHATPLPADAFVPALLSFNLGVEAGQLCVVAAFLALVWVWRRRPWYRRAILVPASLAIAAAGLLWALQRLAA